MVVESKKFKVKYCNTVYTLVSQEAFLGQYEIDWVCSEGWHQTDLRDKSFVDKQFQSGDWYFIEQKVDNKPDAVNHPKHYAIFEQLEAIEVIASSMTADQFYGYCLGNILKYRLRAGGKDDVMQELGKADKYQELFTEYKHLCKGVN